MRQYNKCWDLHLKKKKLKKINRKIGRKINSSDSPNLAMHLETVFGPKTTYSLQAAFFFHSSTVLVLHQQKN